jgi:hypothetical protein
VAEAQVLDHLRLDRRDVLISVGARQPSAVIYETYLVG